MGSGNHKTWFESWPFHLQTEWLWASSSASLSPNFLIQKIESFNVSPKLIWKKTMKVVLLTTFAARDVIYWTINVQQSQKETRNEFFGVGPMLWTNTCIVLSSLTSLPLTHYALASLASFNSWSLQNHNPFPCIFELSVPSFWNVLALLLHIAGSFNHSALNLKHPPREFFIGLPGIPYRISLVHFLHSTFSFFP